VAPDEVGLMFGKKFADYIRFQSWILILLVAAFLVRLSLSLNGASFSQIRWFSMNLVLLLGLIYCAVAVHIRKFGGYRQLFGLLLVQNVLSHTLIALAIVLSIVTARPNVFTAPEVSGGSDGATWVHVAAHAIGGFLVTLFAWLFGSVILFATRKLKPA
jgi:hypothetical protein